MKTASVTITPSDTLRQLADRAAVQLVADAMARIVGGPVDAAGYVDAHGNVSITIDALPTRARRALPPAPPKRPIGRPRKSAQVRRTQRRTDVARGRPARGSTNRVRRVVARHVDEALPTVQETRAHRASR